MTDYLWVDKAVREIVHRLVLLVENEHGSHLTEELRIQARQLDDYAARIAELKAALKPFADKATVYPDLPDNWVAHVTMKHLRAARAAYLGEKE